ncbi:MAG TPA: heme o synthase [Candidatus Polarisedimenticolaceae bacterium]|nr:heme o synthase [Candidatus Polarisedimenticolaceae bacterium]
MAQYVDAEASRAPRLARFADFAALGKPRLSVMVIFTTAIGVWLAPAPPLLATTLLFLLATSCLVAAANTFNCWIERDSDGLMHRTCRRPLPAGRLEPRAALYYGIVLSIASLTAIGLTSNGLTTALGALALAVYVLVYTPMKRVTPWAVVVGAVPGALPPLMGWTAASGEVSIPGLFLFGVLFLWQLPHFIAISLYLRDDFARAGIRALPVAIGRRATRPYLIASLSALVLFSLAALPLGVAGVGYTVVAAVIGVVWLVRACTGDDARAAGDGWARRMFGLSLLYLPLLVSALVLDAF